ncbi:hypothetical protein GCM10027089_10470 [Nocardia thraciensis]
MGIAPWIAAGPLAAVCLRAVCRVGSNDHRREDSAVEACTRADGDQGREGES